MNKWLLITITLTALIVRLWNYNYPPLLWDEASLGYNAYSILHTGKDEYGVKIPLIFKSFGDYKPGLYVYLAIPFVATFGLTPLAVRLPSIILGTLLPLLVYYLITTLSPKSTKIAILSALLIAVNPWNIHFSRGAWETNILLFELILGSLLLFKNKYFPSAIIFGLTLFTYQGGKIMSPLLISIILFIKFQQIFSLKFLSNFVFPLSIFGIVVLFGLLTKSQGNRLSVFALWNYHRPSVETNQINFESTKLNYSLFHNDIIFFSRNFWQRYFNHFSTKFLTFEGDWQTARHSAPYIGVTLYPTIIFFLVGLLSSLALPLSSINKFFLLFLLVAPLPGALTRDIIQPVRTLPLSIPIIYFTAIGINSTVNLFTPKYRHHFYFLLFIFYFLSFIYYTDLYYHHLVKINPQHSLYGYQQAIDYVIQHKDNQQQITFTNFYGQPYIFYLFYSKYLPADFQSQANLELAGPDTGSIKKIDNIKFEVPNFNYQKNLPNQILIFSYDDAIRQGIDLKLLTPLSPINNSSTFYGYKTE